MYDYKLYKTIQSLKGIKAEIWLGRLPNINELIVKNMSMIPFSEDALNEIRPQAKEYLLQISESSPKIYNPISIISPFDLFMTVRHEDVYTWMAKLEEVINA